MPTLASLPFIPYINTEGQLPDELQGQVGVYAIFDQGKGLQYIGYSRDVLLSLRQHLVRRPELCYWLKVQTIERPNRTELEAIRDAWIAENRTVPPGNESEAPLWNQPIDVKTVMTEAEQQSYAAAIDELSQMKVLKQTARRVETEVLEALKARGAQIDVRFNPKLKETGLLDLK